MNIIILMKFTTQIPIADSKSPIDYHSKIFGIGSCFAENMGAKFDFYKFQNHVNPFGIIFNLVSICKIIERVVTNKFFTDTDVFYYENRWHCFEVHSKNSYENREILLGNLNKILTETRIFLQQSTHIILTLGTSWVYENIDNEKVVANCYKLPQKQFVKKLISTEDTTDYIKKIIFLIQSINPKVNFIFTVSPVRHIKDGFFENNVSKGILMQAIFEVIKDDFAINYFPSYEIVIDELRDYRFFEADMLHPNQIAIDYIWERFYDTNIHTNAKEISKKVTNIQRLLLHRPLNLNEMDFNIFQKKIQDSIQNLRSSNPEINF